MSTIDLLISDSSRKFSAKAAVRQKVAGLWRETLYRDLWRDVERVAAGLQTWGLRHGDRVALLGPNSPRWMSSYLGILHAGGIVVPVDKELKSGELRHVLEDCGSCILFTERAYLDGVAEIGRELPDLKKIVLLDGSSDLNALQTLSETIALMVDEWQQLAEKFHIPPDERSRMEALGRQLEGLLRQNSQAETAEVQERGLFAKEALRFRKFCQDHGLCSFDEFVVADTPPRPSGRNSEDTAVILYTSGTTGRSKGAMLSHANIISNIRNSIPRLDVDHTMHTLSFLPINHVFEQVAGMLIPLSLGGTISIAESIKKIGQNLVEEKPSIFLGVPAVFRLLLNRIMKNINDKALSRVLFANPITRPLVSAKVKKNLGGNVTFISGGAALDPEIAIGLEKLGFTIYQGYGITETSPVISVECPNEKKIGSVGRPIPGVEVRIDSPNEEGVGEILVRGPNVMQGYYNRPEETAEVLRGGWYHTGDLGKLDEEGFLTICGRVKNLIVTPSGKNIYPEEVENELLKSPFIAEVMVYGHKLDASEEEVHAQVYPDHEAIDRHVREQGIPPLNEAGLKELIRREIVAGGQRLADYKRVKRFTLRDDEFPKTTTRKIKRFVVEADISATE
ncbi:MAG: AMP-binding protein [Syntrophotaleaceae bacterium]